MIEKKRVIVFLCVILFLMSGAATGQDKSKWPQKMNVACGPIGSASFTPMSSWCPLMNSLLGTNISPEATGGMTINTRMVHANQAHFALT